jgi:hypothetical protein
MQKRCTAPELHLFGACSHQHWCLGPPESRRKATTKNGRNLPFFVVEYSLRGNGARREPNKLNHVSET